MAKKAIIIIILLFTLHYANSQSISYITANKLTYEKYLVQDWKGVIELGKQAKKAGIDFYYLGVRMGVAYFEQGKYFRSIPYFEKALETNPNDEFVKKYLYYAYLYSGLENKSLSIYSNFSGTTKKEIKLTDKKLKSIDFSVSLSPNSELSDLENASYQENHSVFAYTYIGKNITDLNIGLNFQLKDKLFLYQMLSYTNNSYSFVKQATIQDDLNIPMSLSQFRYYGKLSYNLEHNFVFAGNYNLMFGTFQRVNEQLLYMGNLGGFGWKRQSEITTLTFGQFSGGISLSKQLSLFNLKPHIDIFKTYENLNLYSGMDFTFYPLGNSDLYLKTTANYDLLSDESLPLVASGEAGFRLWKFYLYGFYYYGTILNFVENDGYYVYNSTESLNNLVGGGISFFAGNKTFYLSANQAKYNYIYTNYYFDFTETTNFKSFTKLYFKGGIKWKL